MLTQEELDHIAYIQRLAEESSAVVALPPRPPPPSVTAEHKHEEEDEFGLPRYAESIEHEREPSEKSEATSGADEGVLSDVYEEHAFEEKPSHWEPHVTPPSPPARTEDYVEDISSQTAQQHEQEMLTQEELDHIAYIQRLAEESSAVVALPPRPPPPSVTAEHKHEEEDEYGLP
ncbi:unnamed protein product, partial [Heligmosomoides polygyrus]|uniref:Catalase n=1 Tax=Heligmosomoides polygyrus TaxID=6339 RepID=A0A183FCQ9_HELPZ